MFDDDGFLGGEEERESGNGSKRRRRSNNFRFPEQFALRLVSLPLLSPIHFLITCCRVLIVISFILFIFSHGTSSFNVLTSGHMAVQCECVSLLEGADTHLSLHLPAAAVEQEGLLGWDWKAEN